MDLLRNGKNRGESLSDELVSARQKFLEAKHSFEVCNEERFRLQRLRDKAEFEYVDALKRFDEFFGVKQ